MTLEVISETAKVGLGLERPLVEDAFGPLGLATLAWLLAVALNAGRGQQTG